MRQVQGTSLSCRVALSLWSSWRCLLGQATQKNSLCPGEMPRAVLGAASQPALPVWDVVWSGWALTALLPSR